jgi:hypothetical protein
MPLGSLTELFRPPALPGPLGMPLTPASCANDAVDAVTATKHAKAKTHDLPNMDCSPSAYLTKQLPRRSSTAGAQRAA